MKFTAFRDYVLTELGDRPSRKHSFDRIDNSRGYEPGNVRWATPREQVLNRRVAATIEVDGKREAIINLAERHGIPYHLLWSRTQRLNKPLDKALTDEFLSSGRRVSNGTVLEIKGERLNIGEAARKYGVNYMTAYGRLRRGWSPEKALGIHD